MAINPYVKFMRGTPTAWEALMYPNSDTLYFISNPGDTSGKLYLGNKLISSNSVASLNDIADLLISEDITIGSILTYDPTANDGAGAWVDSQISDLINVPIFDGEQAGLIPVDENGTDTIRFLNNNGEWVVLDLDEVAESAAIAQLQTDIGNLNTAITELEEKINSSDSVILSERVENLESLLLDENDELKVITNSIFNTTVGNLNELYDNSFSIVEALNDLNSRLMWEEIK